MHHDRTKGMYALTVDAQKPRARAPNVYIYLWREVHVGADDSIKAPNGVEAVCLSINISVSGEASASCSGVTACASPPDVVLILLAGELVEAVEGLIVHEAGGACHRAAWERREHKQKGEIRPRSTEDILIT